PLKVINGTSGNPGVWRYDVTNQVWLNLTAQVSTTRQSGTSVQATPNPTPRTPGPDDDFRLSFPQTATTWSDVALVGTTLFAALGNGAGNANDGVYRLTNPFAAANQLTWYVGDPTNAA